jgi:hypothetical protein
MRATWVVVVLAAACGGPQRVDAPGASTDAGVATEAADAATTAPAEAKLVDQGVFLLDVGGQPVGRETFVIRDEGERRITDVRSVLALGGQKVAQEIVLITDHEWRPIGARFAVEAGGQKLSGTVVEKDGVLVQTAGESTVTATGPVDLIVSNNVMAHLTPLCMWAAGLPRTFTVFPGAKLELGAARDVPAPSLDPLVASRTLTVVDAVVAGQLGLTLLCSEQQLLAVAAPAAGFTAVREGSEALASIITVPARPKPLPPMGVVQVERTVTVPAQDGVPAATLGCTLTLPRTHAKLKKRPGAKGKPRPLPAVVFLTGSGAQDRDEDTPGPGGLKLAIFATLAHALAEKGVASLRCDDRGVGASTGDFAAATVPVFVADARAQLALLAAEPAVDPARLGVVGHSEGGVVALLVARAEPTVRALVLLATPGCPIDALILEQTRAALARQGMGKAAIDERVGELAAVFAALRAGTPETLSAEDRQVWDTPWMRSHLALDPAKLAAELKTPAVLIAQGGRDVQVRLADSEALHEAFRAGGNGGVRYEIYPELNHLFSHTDTGDIADYFDPRAVLDASLVRDVVAFLVARL